MNITVGIDASRLRSGGGIEHVKGVIDSGNPCKYGINQVHLWSYSNLLHLLPAKSWLIKHNADQLEGSIWSQLWWQNQILRRELQSTKCNILFTVDASTICYFRPSVVLSQDMQSYEPGIMKRYGLSAKLLRLYIIGILQKRAIKRAAGVIFLTSYAKRIIQDSTGIVEHTVIIPHGVGSEFQGINVDLDWDYGSANDIRCVYISNTAIYKNQWFVVRAIGALRKKGYRVSLHLVGGGKGKGRRLTEKAIDECDPRREFIKISEYVPHAKIGEILGNSKIFIFASSCENMPVTLLEGMAAGMPIACSNCGPMPEILQDGGVYFDPRDSESIGNALEQIIIDSVYRKAIARRAREIALHYTWQRCADETWRFIAETFKRA